MRWVLRSFRRSADVPDGPKSLWAETSSASQGLSTPDDSVWPHDDLMITSCHPWPFAALRSRGCPVAGALGSLCSSTPIARDWEKVEINTRTTSKHVKACQSYQCQNYAKEIKRMGNKRLTWRTTGLLTVGPHLQALSSSILVLGSFSLQCSNPPKNNI